MTDNHGWMHNQRQNPNPLRPLLTQTALVQGALTRGALTKGIVGLAMAIAAQTALTLPSQAAVNRFCHLSQADVDRKSALREAGFQGDAASERQYRALSRQQASEVHGCRRTQWPENQAVWLRLYPQDLQPGRLDEIMDRVLNLGYNQVYIE